MRLRHHLHEKAERDGYAAAYHKPALGFNLYRWPEHATYVSIPGSPDGIYNLIRS